VAWLRNDLALNTKPCIAAFMHHPRFFSSTTPNVSTEAGSLRPVWDELYKHGVEFVASGNRHHYERLKPMRADGTVDTELGVTQFISGTGGTSLGLPQPTTGSVHPNSDVRGLDYGVVKFTLKPDGYDWQFVPARNRFNDAGSANCHPPTIPVTLLVSSSVASSAYGEPVTFTAKAEDGSRTVRIGTVSFISGGTCDAPAEILASDLTLDLTGRARATVSTLDVSGSPYVITACYTGAGSYRSSSGQVAYSVTKQSATVTLGSLFHNYDGQTKSASASTDAAGESAFQFAYQLNGTAVAQPTEPGSYGVVATLINANYQGSASGTLIINAVPVGTSDSYSTDEDKPLTVTAPGVLANDTDVDAGQTLQAVLESGPAHGSVTLNPDGSFSYTPVVDYNGTDSFSYRASDGVATSAPATVTIDIKAVDDPPLAVTLDILPGSSTNTLALDGKQTQIVFAVHSSTSFDATLIDPDKVTIGDEQGAEAPLARNADGTFKFMLVDVTGDGRRDFYAYANKADLRSNGDLTLTTKSLTVLGGLKAPSTVLFRGTDKVNVVP
jgi:VCBS repeat-containing protein